MTTRLFDTLESLSEIASQWGELAGDHPMHGPDWLTGWWAHYGVGRLFVLGVFEDDRLIGLAPWRMERTVRRGSVVRWLGDGEVCTDHLTLLAAEHRQQEVAGHVADFLTDEFTDWDLLKLDDTDADDRRLAMLAEALENRGSRLQSRQAGACWSIALPEDWEEFLAQQSKSHRKQLRRAERRVLESERCRWHPVCSADELDRAWPILVDLHQRRRQSLGEPGCFASSTFEAFHRELAGRLLEKGQLRMSWLELEGQPAAAEIHYAGAGAVFAYQGGVDPERLDDEPGRLSNIATIKAAIEEGATEFDFLRGDEPYKAHWRAQPRPTVHLQWASPRRSSQLRAGADRFVGRVRTSLQSWRRRP